MNNSEERVKRSEGGFRFPTLQRWVNFHFQKNLRESGMQFIILWKREKVFDDTNTNEGENLLDAIKHHNGNAKGEKSLLVVMDAQ